MEAIWYTFTNMSTKAKRIALKCLRRQSTELRQAIRTNKGGFEGHILSIEKQVVSFEMAYSPVTDLDESQRLEVFQIENIEAVLLMPWEAEVVAGGDKPLFTRMYYPNEIQR